MSPVTQSVTSDILVSAASPSEPETPSVTQNDTSDTLTTAAQADTSDTLPEISSVPGYSYITASGAAVSHKLVRPWTNVQDAHTPSEQLLYNFLYGKARKDSDREGTKPVRVTFLEMNRGTGISRRQAIRVIHSLQEKMAICVLETGRAEDKSGSVYQVHSMSTIADNRRKQGYTFVYRNRTAVDLVRLIQNVTSASVSPVHGDTSDRLTLVSGVSLSPVTSVSLTPSLDNKKGTTQFTSNDDFTPILETLISYTGPCDDQAARKLLSECRLQAPDASVEEVVELLHQTATRMVGRRNITSPRGLLLSMVPLQFQPVALGIYRRQKLERQMVEQRQREQDLRERVETARELLKDTTIPADLRQWAEEILQEAGQQGGEEF